MTELRITTDLEALPRELSFNFDELKTELTAQLERYQGLIITEDGIKEGKEDRAKLNKLKQTIDTCRKEIKKRWNEPYAAFEAKIKEVIALIDAPIAAIDSQLTVYEEARKAEKQAEIEELYHRIAPEDIQELIPLDRIVDPRWVNKSTSLAAIEEAITITVNRTQSDLEALKNVDPEHEAAVRREYNRTLDLGAAMRCLAELREAAAAIKQARPTENPPEAVKPTESVQAPLRAPEPTENIYLLRLAMQVTKAQADALKRFLEDNNIKHERI